MDDHFWDFDIGPEKSEEENKEFMLRLFRRKILGEKIPGYLASCLEEEKNAKKQNK